MAAQLLGTAHANDLIQRIFDHADGQAGGDVFDGNTVLLRLLDGGVHKHRAARAQVYGLIGKKTLARKVPTTNVVK